MHRLEAAGCIYNFINLFMYLCINVLMYQCINVVMTYAKAIYDIGTDSLAFAFNLYACSSLRIFDNCGVGVQVKIGTEI